MREIQLNRGKVALVDNDQYDYLNQFKWYANKPRNIWYVCRHSPMINNERHTIYMHWEVIGKPPKGFHTDHVDGDGRNNQRNNLRHVTVRQNGQNIKHGKRHSQYPGVSWHTRDKKWVAMARINGPQKWLGTFDTEFEAFKAYRQTVNEIGETVINTE